ncbi:hypothetical protein HYPSUDRAFT_196365 [Hypholoma sublateritium FD-334 SS-4]|uniref:Uncharacterized protein n=1 Tax=Hypholoma sublateritium (strain FD-334 SS-4) TaxID=945553 RepID=A0A0D2PGX3_HYPSF|nr:hypothetical protein HYPSUDRAFT_196365 [Hypholoma sublateritium FD-334 SS-4]
MNHFESRRPAANHRHATASSLRGLLHRKDKGRVVGGLRASLANAMGRERGTHVSLVAQIKGALGMTPRRTRAVERTRY